MPRRSTISRLPAEQRHEIHTMRGDGATIDEIYACLKERGFRVSRGAVGRYMQAARPAVARFYLAREMAGEWTEAIRRQPESDAGLLAGELLKLLAWHRAGALEEAAASGEEVDARDIRHLAGSLRDLASADALASKRIEAARREEREAAAAAAGEAAQQAGLTPEVAEIVRRAVEGAG